MRTTTIFRLVNAFFFSAALVWSTESPSAVPSEVPSEAPSPDGEATEVPSQLPSFEPSEDPTSTPSPEAPIGGTEVPSQLPSFEPSEVPSVEPSIEQTSNQEPTPTSPAPSQSPSATPEPTPVGDPTVVGEPTVEPTPVGDPTVVGEPTVEPTVNPTRRPTRPQPTPTRPQPTPTRPQPTPTRPQPTGMRPTRPQPTGMMMTPTRPTRPSGRKTAEGVVFIQLQDVDTLMRAPNINHYEKQTCEFFKKYLKKANPPVTDLKCRLKDQELVRRTNFRRQLQRTRRPIWTELKVAGDSRKKYELDRLLAASVNKNEKSFVNRLKDDASSVNKNYFRTVKRAMAVGRRDCRCKGKGKGGGYKSSKYLKGKGYYKSSKHLKGKGYYKSSKHSKYVKGKGMGGWSWSSKHSKYLKGKKRRLDQNHYDNDEAGSPMTVRVRGEQDSRNLLLWQAAGGRGNRGTRRKRVKGSRSNKGNHGRNNCICR